MWNRVIRMMGTAGAALTVVACGYGPRRQPQLTESARRHLGTAAARGDDSQGDADQGDDRSEDGPRGGVGHRTVAHDDAETLQGEHDPEKRRRATPAQ